MRVLIITFLLLLPCALHAAPTVSEFMALPADKQKSVLREVGYQEGEVGDLQALLNYSEALHQKYDSIADLKGLSLTEHELLFELAMADNTLMMFANDKKYLLRGCELGYKLTSILPLEKANVAQAACYEKYKELTPDELNEVQQLSLKGYETIIQRASESNDPQKNYYLADNGRYLCDSNINCDDGSLRMFRALLAEYSINGAKDFSVKVLEATGPLFNYLIQKNIRSFMAYRELEYELYKTGKLGGNENNYYQTNEQRAEEFRPDAVNHPQLVAVLADMDAGRSILEMEVERFRRDPANFSLEPSIDGYAEEAKTESVSEPNSAGVDQPKAVSKPEPSKEGKEVVAESGENQDEQLLIGIVAGAAVLLLMGWYAIRRGKK